MSIKDVFLEMNETLNTIYEFIENVFDFSWLKAFFGFIGGIVSYLFGGMGFVIQILIALILLDLFTGVCSALVKQKLSSKNFSRGCWKLFSYIVVIFTIRMVELAVMGNITFFTNMLISLLIITEAISIFENCVILGVPIPRYFINFIAHSDRYKKKKERYK